MIAKLLFISCMFILCLISIIGGVLGRSSSTNWKLSEHQRAIIRYEGYCMDECDIGYDSETDGYDAIMKHYHKTKKEGTFDDLKYELDGENDLMYASSDLAPLLMKKGDEVYEDLSVSETEGIELITDVYCKYSCLSFDECTEIKRSLVTEYEGEECMNECLDEVFSQHSLKIPDFKDMSPVRQNFEKCLDEFSGPDAFFNYKNRTSIIVKDMLHILQKNGFVVIENFFPTELMAKVNDFMNNWEELGELNNLTYSDFYSVDRTVLNNYENRLEIVLPYIDLFEKILSTIHESILMELISAYGSYQPINLDFPSSIISRPGALEQSIHTDHGYSAGMLKLNVAIHDIPEKSGPTSFCPCTHQHGNIYAPYKNECKIRYHPKLVKAGTVTIYDQSMKHNGMANNGDLKRRYILDLSYNIGNVKNNYTSSYPEVATEHIRKYRESYQNLNLVFD